MSCFNIENLKKRWKYYQNQNKDLCWIFRIFGFIWKKEYKKFILFIWVLGTWILYKLNLSDNELVLSFIYFSTGIIIFWYTRETYDLKVIQEKGLREARKQTDFEMKPYLRLQWSENNNEVFQIVNCGRGLAVDVEFKRFELTINLQTISFYIKKRPLISAGNGVSSVSVTELVDNIEVIKGGSLDQQNVKKFIFHAAKEFGNHYIVCAKYKDIENNKSILPSLNQI